MKREDVIRLAKEADMMDGYSLNTAKLDRFAALVASAERERCAKVCDCEEKRADEAHDNIAESGDRHLYMTGKGVAANKCASLIRALGDE